MNEKLSLEQAATQLLSYTKPKGFWIGSAWIDSVILERLIYNLERALEEHKQDKKDR